MEDERRIEIERDGIDQLPSIAELQALLADGYTFILLRYAFGPEHHSFRDMAKDALIARISDALPECSVFNSGGENNPHPTSRITIMCVVPAQIVIENEARLLTSIRAFRDTATDLMVRLAVKRNVSLSEFSDERYGGGEKSGRLDDDWLFNFHGFECSFENEKTEQWVDVIVVESDGDFGAINPWFFHLFVSSTPEWNDIARLFPNGYHDTARAFDILEARGVLVRTKTPGGSARLFLTRTEPI